MSRSLWSLFVLVAACGSGDDVIERDGGARDAANERDAAQLPDAFRPPPCDGDSFAYMAWVLDGEPGSHCARMIATAVPIGSPPTQSVIIGGYGGCMLPLGYNGAALYLYNIPLVTGQTGTLTGGDVRGTRTFPAQIGADHTGVHAEVYLGLYDGPAAECGPRQDDSRYSIAGTFHVVRGGVSGDVVEVEARDVRFLPAHDGQDLRFEWLYWRALVTEVHDPPPPTRPRDGGL